jgi:hypothetical protein
MVSLADEIRVNSYRQCEHLYRLNLTAYGLNLTAYRLNIKSYVSVLSPLCQSAFALSYKQSNSSSGNPPSSSRSSL